MPAPSQQGHDRRSRYALPSLAFFLFATLVLAGCSPARWSESAKVLADVDAGWAPSELKGETPEPERHGLRFAMDGRTYAGDIYVPGEPSRAAMVLVPGVSPQGKDDPRLVAFANTLARARFRVLVPDLPNLRELRVRPGDAQAIADASRWFREELEPEHPLGVTAISYAVGPAVGALFEPDTEAAVDFVVAVGGYYDLTAVVTFVTTGGFRATDGEPWRHRDPNPYGKWVFLRSNIAQLESSTDRMLLDGLARTKLQDPAADVSELVDRLSPEGRAVYALLDNRDPDRVSGLIAALPEGVRRDFRDLDLAKRDVSRLGTRFVLIHGRDDPVMPETESVKLAEALPGDRARLYLVDNLNHVEPEPVGFADKITLLRAIHAVLSLRDEERSAGPIK